MFKLRPALFPVILILLTTPLPAEDWTRFRGAGGLGVSAEQKLPVKWSATENVAWTATLPGPGASSPIVQGRRVFITCYSGYGLEPNQGEQTNLIRHLLCLDRNNGKVLWQKQFEPKLPEHAYQGEGAYHGYAGSTPLTDGERLYVFFGKSGVFCFDLDGKEIWTANVGDGTNGWGSGCSPIVYENLLIVNASVESGALVALDKLSGAEVWRTKGIHSSWNTPILVQANGSTELVVSIQDFVVGFDPAKGTELWRAEGIHRYVCPSLVAHEDVIFVTGGGQATLAIRAGGRGTVTESHTLWRENKGSNVGSPVYHDGYLYWGHDSGGIVCCQDAATGKFLFQERLEPRPGQIWSSPVLADGKLYFVSQHEGTFVVAAQPKFELLAHNVFADDKSRTNASPAVSNGQLFLRTDRALYCIGKQN